MIISPHGFGSGLNTEEILKRIAPLSRIEFHACIDEINDNMNINNNIVILGNTYILKILLWIMSYNSLIPQR